MSPAPLVLDTPNGEAVHAVCAGDGRYRIATLQSCANHGNIRIAQFGRRVAFASTRHGVLGSGGWPVLLPAVQCSETSAGIW
jgi:hypothetical protein